MIRAKARSVILAKDKKTDEKNHLNYESQIRYFVCAKGVITMETLVKCFCGKLTSP